MTPRARQLLRSAVRRVVLASTAGAIFGATFDDARIHVARGALAGACISALIIAANHASEMRDRPWSIRRAPFALALGIKSLWFSLAALLGIGLATWLVPGPGARLPDAAAVARIFAFALGIALVFNLLRMLVQLVGWSELANFAVGRYHRPRSERRIFLFIDLESSTAVAERLGDERFHTLLDRFFDHISDPILARGGEVYKYVGDEVIVSWPTAAGRRDAACVRCCFEIEDTIARHAAEYERRFGVVPSFRAGLHEGAVVTGEMGEIKREIAFIGDTVNTTARIEQLCRDKQRRVIASARLLDGMTLPEGVRGESLGTMRLRGKREELELFALERA